MWTSVDMQTPLGFTVVISVRWLAWVCSLRTSNLIPVTAAQVLIDTALNGKSRYTGDLPGWRSSPPMRLCITAILHASFFNPAELRTTARPMMPAWLFNMQKMQPSVLQSLHRWLQLLVRGSAVQKAWFRSIETS